MVLTNMTVPRHTNELKVQNALRRKSPVEDATFDIQKLKYSNNTIEIESTWG